ncbi:MAG: hypothetical protein ACRDNF_19890, partial [Streptosporangiaceae bacterium]
AGRALAAAGVALGPAGAVALGAAGFLFESLAERTWEELRPSARQRAAQVLSTAAGEIGSDDERLGELIGSSETSTLQAGLAMDAAQRTAWPPKVYALGRALAAGLIATDEAEVDIQQQALAAMTDMERLHVALLELLVRYEPGSKFDPDLKRRHLVATPHRFPSYNTPFLGAGEPGNLQVWSVGRRMWSVSEIVVVRPQLRPVLGSLLGTLQRHGLAAEDDGAREELKQLTDDLVQQVNQHAGQMQRSRRSNPVTLRDPTLRGVEPSWKPTELGETILGYYRLAGEEEITDAPDPGQPEG